MQKILTNTIQFSIEYKNNNRFSFFMPVRYEDIETLEENILNFWRKAEGMFFRSSSRKQRKGNKFWKKYDGYVNLSSDLCQ